MAERYEATLEEFAADHNTLPGDVGASTLLTAQFRFHEYHRTARQYEATLQVQRRTTRASNVSYHVIMQAKQEISHDAWVASCGRSDVETLRRELRHAGIDAMKTIAAVTEMVQDCVGKHGLHVAPNDELETPVDNVTSLEVARIYQQHGMFRYQIVPNMIVPQLLGVVHNWLSRIPIERLEQRMRYLPPIHAQDLAIRTKLTVPPYELRSTVVQNFVSAVVQPRQNLQLADMDIEYEPHT